MSNTENNTTSIVEKATKETGNLQQKSFTYKRKKQLWVKIQLWAAATAVVFMLLTRLESLRGVADYLMLFVAFIIIAISILIFFGTIQKWAIKHSLLREYAKELNEQKEAFEQKQPPYNTDNSVDIFETISSRIIEKASKV